MTRPVGFINEGWEEVAYGLRGYGELGYVLKNGKIVSDATKWIKGIMATQDEDGYFGPKSLKPSPMRPIPNHPIPGPMCPHSMPSALIMILVVMRTLLNSRKIAFILKTQFRTLIK